MTYTLTDTLLTHSYTTEILAEMFEKERQLIIEAENKMNEAMHNEDITEDEFCEICAKIDSNFKKIEL